MRHIRDNPKGHKFNPRQDWCNDVEYVDDPDATLMQIEVGVRMVFAALEESMRRFVPAEYRRFVQFYQINPKPPLVGHLGWRYLKR